MRLEKVQSDLIDEWIISIDFTVVGRKTTICTLTTKTGFEIVGTSACLNIDAIDTEVTNYSALKDAADLLEEFVTFYHSHT